MEPLLLSCRALSSAGLSQRTLSGLFGDHGGVECLTPRSGSLDLKCSPDAVAFNAQSVRDVNLEGDVDSSDECAGVGQRALQCCDGSAGRTLKGAGAPKREDELVEGWSADGGENGEAVLANRPGGVVDIHAVGNTDAA